MPTRAATHGDIAVLVELMTDFYRESSFSLPRESAKAVFEQLLTDPALGRVWICEQGREAAGYIVLTFGFSVEYGGRDAFVDDLFIRPAFRGRGLGKQLLDTLIGECAHLRVRALHLEVDRLHDRAHALYRSRGFQDNDRRLLTMKLSGAIHESHGSQEKGQVDSMPTGGSKPSGGDHE